MLCALTVPCRHGCRPGLVGRSRRPTPQMSPGRPLFGAIAMSTRAAGIGASPASTLPSGSSVSPGRCGSNGPFVACDARDRRRRSRTGRAAFEPARSRSCRRRRSRPRDRWSAEPVTACGRATCRARSSWMSQRFAGARLNGSLVVREGAGERAQSSGSVIAPRTERMRERARDLDLDAAVDGRRPRSCRHRPDRRRAEGGRRSDRSPRPRGCRRRQDSQTVWN